ncbi:uncharacterized protein [Gorilla gorilla gorilla]|uniref:uncharacterized protein n=1 Tax=Gorilla gorilla gorilla TaxID=9595 RepID=UPI0030092A40
MCRGGHLRRGDTCAEDTRTSGILHGVRNGLPALQVPDLPPTHPLRLRRRRLRRRRLRRRRLRRRRLRRRRLRRRRLRRRRLRLRGPGRKWTARGHFRFRQRRRKHGSGPSRGAGTRLPAERLQLGDLPHGRSPAGQGNRRGGGAPCPSQPPQLRPSRCPWHHRVRPSPGPAQSWTPPPSVTACIFSLFPSQPPERRQPQSRCLPPLLMPDVFMLASSAALQCGRGVPRFPRTEVGAGHSVNEETKAEKVGNQTSVIPATSRQAALGTSWTQTRT